MKRHVMSVLVESNPISFNRVLGMLSRKGYWIEHFTIVAAADPEVSRITFAVTCENWTRSQLKNQLEKLSDVLKTDAVQGDSLYGGTVLATAK